MTLLKKDRGILLLLFLSIFVALFLLQACNYDQMLEDIAPKEKINSAQKHIDFILNSDYTEMKKVVTSEINEQLNQDILDQIHDFVPKEKPILRQLVGFNFTTFNYTSSTKINEDYTFQYQYSDRWILVTLNLQTENDQKPLIGGFNFVPIQGNLREINKFTFEGKPLQNYIILLAAVIVPIFIIISLIMCYKVPILKRKWLWYLFIAFGFCSFQLEWTMGQLMIQPTIFQLLGAGFFRASIYGPVIINASIPIGAILFQIKRIKLLKA